MYIDIYIYIYTHRHMLNVIATVVIVVLVFAVGIIALTSAPMLFPLLLVSVTISVIVLGCCSVRFLLLLLFHIWLF